MDPLKTSSNGNNYICVIGDYFTKFVEAYQIKLPKLWQTVWLQNGICAFGVPLTIHTDQGRNYESELFKQVCKLLDIEKTRTVRYRPNSDEQIERSNRVIRSILRAMIAEHERDWEDHLPDVIMAYRATIHESTKCTPNSLMFGQEVRLPVDIMLGDPPNTNNYFKCHVKYEDWLKNSMQNAFHLARDNLRKNAERQKRYSDRNTKLRKFKVGEWVWVFYSPNEKDKFSRGWIGPYLIVDKFRKVNYKVQNEKSGWKLLYMWITLKLIHMKHLKLG